MSETLACLRKRKYESEGLAWSVIFNLRARGQDTESLEPHRCERCHQWHLRRRDTTTTELSPKVIEALSRLDR